MDDPDDNFRTTTGNTSSRSAAQSVGERKSSNANTPSLPLSEPQIPGGNSIEGRRDTSIPLQQQQTKDGPGAVATHSDEGSSSTTLTNTPRGALQTGSPGETLGQNHESAKIGQDEGVSASQEKTKKDRSKLRKGKWTVEEEEYTSRIIQHFSTGLLTLPNGATLRSYLADKLNCDPMRITKKFTGACCLGRRVYHLREKPRGSPAEIEMAKAELHHLEQRFRMRVEHEQSGLPLSRQQEILLAQPPSTPSPLYPIQGLAGGGNPVWGSQFSSGGIPLNSALAALQGSASIQGLSRATQSPLAALGTPASQWLLPTGSDLNAPTPQISSVPDQSLLLLNNLVNSWAWSQATASLRPALSGLAIATASASAPAPVRVQTPTPHVEQKNHQARKTNEDLQRQLRETFEEHKREELKRTSQLEATSSDTKPSARPTTGGKEAIPKAEISPAEQLQKSYEEHLKSLNLRPQGVSSDNAMSATPPEPNIVERAPRASHQSQEKKNSKMAKVSSAEKQIEPKERKKNGVQQAPPPQETPTAEEEAGTILLGFLNSLRRSYEDAVDVTEQEKITSQKEGMVIPTQNEKKSSLPRASSVQAANTAASTSTAESGTQTVPMAARSRKKRGLGKIAPQENPRNGSIVMSEGNAPFNRTPGAPRTGRPASVTDTSTLSRSETSSGGSNPTESSSSLEDSDSKSDKTDGSSSEESEKECNMNMASKGPPRKRLKHRKFTKRNLLEHSRLQQASNESLGKDGF